MAKKELPDEGPSLEMPSLGSLFKRGRKKGPKEETRGDADQQPSAEDFERLVRGSQDDEPAAAEEPATATDVAPVDEPAAAEQPVVDEPAAEEPPVADKPAAVAEPVAAEEPAAATEPAEVAEVAEVAELTEAPAVDAQVAAPEEPTAPEAVVEPEPAPAPEPVTEPEQFDAPESAVEQTAVRDMPAVTADIPTEEPVETPPAPAAAEPQETKEAGEPEVIPELPEHDLIAEVEEPDLGDIEADDAAPDDVEQTAVAAFKPIPAAPEEPRPQGAARAARPATASSTTDAEPLEDEPAAEEEPARAPFNFTLPAIPSLAAAGVTGVLIGILAVALTYFGLRGCEAIRGTSTCGGPGIQILIVNMIILVVVGSMLLKAWKVTDPTSTSFLAVGLLAVISLLFLIEVIFSASMIVVIPLVSAGTYALSQWVTERFIEEE